MKALKACKSITNEKEHELRENKTLKKEFFSISAASTREKFPPTFMPLCMREKKSMWLREEGKSAKHIANVSNRNRMRKNWSECCVCMSYHHKRKMRMLTFKFMRLTRKQKCLKEDMKWQESLHSASRKLLYYELYIYTSWTLILAENPTGDRAKIFIELNVWYFLCSHKM